MGYRISYENGGKRTEIPNKDLLNKNKIVKWAIFSVSIIMIIIVLQVSTIRRFLLPGNGAVTEAAIIDLVASIQEGETVGQAVTTFCRQIIENAA